MYALLLYYYDNGDCLADDSLIAVSHYPEVLENIAKERPDVDLYRLDEDLPDSYAWGSYLRYNIVQLSDTVGAWRLDNSF